MNVKLSASRLCRTCWFWVILSKIPGITIFNLGTSYYALGEYQKAIELAKIALAGNESFIEVQQEKDYATQRLNF